MKNKQNDYFCTINCYTRFRLGIGIDYTTIVCRFPRIEIDATYKTHTLTPKPGFIDYERYNYCRRCRLKLDKIKYPRCCPDCRFRISTRKRNKLRKTATADKKMIIVDNRIRIDAL